MNSIMLVFAIFTDSEFKKIKKGDPESIEKLYLHYRDRIFTFLLKKTGGNVDAANDILSETFAEVLASVSRLKNRENIGGWVFGIACNVFKGYVKKYEYKKKIIKFAEEQQSQIPPDSFIEAIDKKYKYYLLETAIEQLKPLHRRVFTMKYIEEKKHKEIAVLLNKTENAVRVLLFRIKREIQLQIHKIDKSFFK